MRSSVLAAAFAAGAAAVPYGQKRDVVTDYDVVYYTHVVTVTAGPEPTTSTVDVEPETPAATTSAAQHYGHHWKPWHWVNPDSSSPEATSESSAAPAPSAYTSSWATTWTSEWSEPASSSVEPEPTTTQAPSSTYVAPSTSETPSSTYEAPSSSAASSGDAPLASTYQEIVKVHHNVHRTNHSAPDIEWDEGLAATAKKIADSCVYAHNTEEDGGGYGQNIAAGVEGGNVSQVITDLFYNGEVNAFAGQYGKAQPDMTDFHVWGHFTQLVWKSTTKVGCYTTDCSSQGLANVGGNVPPFFTVCNYDAPGKSHLLRKVNEMTWLTKLLGNYANEYADNVMEGDAATNPTVNFSYGIA